MRQLTRSGKQAFFLVERSLAETPPRNGRTELASKSRIETMISKIKTRLLIFASILIPSILSAGEPLALPESVEAKIDEILKIKKEALNQPGMRSEESVLGKRVEALVGEIGELITDPESIRKIKDSEEKDIKAKIALWSLDRKARPDEYRRFAKYYVNRPAAGEYAEYESRRYGKAVAAAPDPFAERETRNLTTVAPLASNSVDDDDRKEEFRQILEYCFYMPPAGLGFSAEQCRWHLATALLSIGNSEKSLVVMANDAEMSLTAETQSAVKDEWRFNSTVPLIFLTKSPAEKSFTALSRIGTTEFSKNRVESTFRKMWTETIYGKVDPADREAYDAWQAIAAKNWETPDDKSLAEWLKKQPRPKD